MRHRIHALALLSLCATPLLAQVDTTSDGWPDLSKFLDKPYGFFPLLFPITEPAVGYGLGGALIFIDKRAGQTVDVRHPRITAVGGAYTENGTWAVFGGHIGYAFNNKLKWRAGGVYANLFLTFYGLSEDSPLQTYPLEYEITSYGGVVGGQYQIGSSNFRAGVDYLLAQTELDISPPDPVPPELGPYSNSTRLAALRPSVTFDSRNNVFTPLRGFYADVSVSLFGKAVGSEESFSRGGIITLTYFPLRRNLFFGLKAEGNSSSGDTPFYLKPFVSLRGLAAQRIQGETVADAEAELRWQFWKRFSAVGFVGAGGGWSDADGVDRSSSVMTGGTGFRYQIAKRYGLHMGLDVGFGPDDPVLYVQFGSAWARP